MAYRSSSKARLGAFLTATATGAITLALLAGMPYVLWHATGVPWPDRIGSWHDLSAWLMQPVADPVMVDLLAMVGWVCWAAFAWSLVTEAAWYALHLPQLLRDRTAHAAHLETLPVQRALAALCIGTLALAVISLWRPPAANAHQHTPVDGVRAPITATAPAHAGSTKDKGESDPTRAARSTQARGVEYTVAEGDTLWDIAGTHLGDPLKWPRVYALNKNRIQADGQRLTDPDQLTPGWQLTIPTTPAASSPNHSAPPTAHPAPTKPSTPPMPTAQPPADPTAGHSAEHDTASRATGEHTTNHARPGPAAISVGTASMIGITTAAGLLAALRFFRFYQNRFRRPSLDAQPPPLSPVIEKAVVAAREAGLPRSTAADPGRLITRRTPPQPPQPACTVTIGTANASEISLDALAGGCAWTGPGAEAAARALVIGILTAAERLRPQTPRIRGLLTQDLSDRLLPGTPPEFSALASAEDLDEAIRRAEAHLLAHARHHQDTQEAAHSPLPATTDGPGERTGPDMLVLLTEPNTAQSSYLAALASRAPHGALIVLALGDLPGTAAWRIGSDGTVNQQTGDGNCASSLQLFHLTPQAGQDVLDMLLTAHEERPRPRMVPGARAAADPPQHPDEDADRDPEDDPPPAQPEPVEPVKLREANQDKPVRLNVLGPATLYAHGNPEPVGLGLRGEVREFLALLAAHPTGLIADDIVRHLRLSEDPDQSAKELKNLRRAVRRTLRTATGHSKAEFIQLHGELHKLHTGLIETDLAAFTEALHHAASAPDGPARLAALCRAVDLYHGPFAHGGDYPWCDSIRESLANKAADAVAHIAHHAEHTGTRQDADAALDHLEKAIGLNPTHELLYQHAIRLHQAAGRHDTARHTFTLLTRHLNELGLEPDPATRALVINSTRSSARPG
ncbi:BTAD domain-containing putative transcriptional regulator [Streptomyces sp. NEAU-YJ-81]|uniref:BTAD domain-containing putative transcriptional regulator n=1 Tax=Streptomyces sp. NEAU-YJ-81 TaxID=2820288 RepID=UPI001ABC2EB3|nr:BTAD domain-containing putative transcriptional regulator [Streptomyces sp. NEAU-YJ-81]MBO3682700.1 LysM peptidoglycan-binding domain-containing protein [Streptomyces sp. NEAU-YJ-81]